MEDKTKGGLLDFSKESHASFSDKHDVTGSQKSLQHRQPTSLMAAFEDVKLG